MFPIIRLIISVLCLFYCSCLSAQNIGLTTAEKHAIRAYVNDLRYGRKELVAAALHYPMAREYPLTPIIDETEFLRHYDDFIDAPFISEIESAQWERIGWRGICCNSGFLWGDIDDNGEFYIHQYDLNEKGQSLLKESIEKQRNRLFPELQVFDRPVFMFKTIKFTIRVDLMPDGSYRYASWSSGRNISSKPDIIINNGIKEIEGSLPLINYLFTNGDYEYAVREYHIDGHDFELSVSIKGNTLMIQYGDTIY